jgi:hypothetical protein
VGLGGLEPVVVHLEVTRFAIQRDQGSESGVSGEGVKLNWKIYYFYLSPQRISCGKKDVRA